MSYGALGQSARARIDRVSGESQKVGRLFFAAGAGARAVLRGGSDILRAPACIWGQVTREALGVREALGIRHWALGGIEASERHQASGTGH